MYLLQRIIGIIITTFFIAALYGALCATMDVLVNDQPDPVRSGHRAADNIYSLFGTVTEEAKRNDAGEAPARVMTVGQKIAAPYAVTADVVGILTGKFEHAVGHILHKTGDRLDVPGPGPDPKRHD